MATSNKHLPSKTRFAQMLIAEQARRGATDREIADAHGWKQQTFSAWKFGSLPRPNMFASLSSYLNISADMVAEVVEEAQQSVGSTRIPKAAVLGAARHMGRISDRKAGKYAFDAYNNGRKFVPEGRYSISIDTKIMEPALLVGTKAWLDPAVWPAPGNDVLAHAAGGVAWIGKLVKVDGSTAELERYAGPPVTVRDLKAVHVIVLAERVSE